MQRKQTLEVYKHKSKNNQLE